MKSAREIRLFRMVRIVCAVVFVIFSFTYLSIYQAPLLEVVYDITATGKLQYDGNITAAIILIFFINSSILQYVPFLDLKYFEYVRLPRNNTQFFHLFDSLLILPA